MRGLHHAVLPLLLLVAFSHAPGAARGNEDELARVPVANTSYVRTDAPWHRALIRRSDDAIEKDDWPTAVRLLQEIVERIEDPEDPGAAMPDVLPVYGTMVYEGAWIAAHHRILAGGEAALAAYAFAFGAAASNALERATEERNPSLLVEVATRWLPLPEGRRAALLLAELAVEAGDTDQAIGWLERIQTLEEVTRESPEALAPWREARIRVQAAAIARPGKTAEVEDWLRRVGSAEASPRIRYAPVPPALRRAVEPVVGWPTTRGNAARNGLPPSLGTSFSLAWANNLESGVEPDDDDEPGRARPSPWVPATAVVDGGVAFVSDGSHLHVWDLATGRSEIEAPYPLWSRRGDRGLGWPSISEARTELGLLEGHTLTLGPMTERGRIIYAAAPDPVAGEWWDYRRLRDDVLAAYTYDGFQVEDLWRRGGFTDRRGEPEDAAALVGVRLYGAPLLYRGRLWIVGLTPSRGSETQANLWLLGYAPLTGELEVRTYLGTAPPVRSSRPDEGIPSSPAGAAGRVVVSTSMGVVASVDAHTGRPVWILRNDRGVVGAGRPRRLTDDSDPMPRESGFENRPPLLAYERVWVAPTDGPRLLCLFDRPRGAERALVSYDESRMHVVANHQVEQVVGLHPGGPGLEPALVVAGKGRAVEGATPAPIAAALAPFTLGRRWEVSATTGDGPELAGAALLTMRELFVPTRHGISVYDLASGADAATLDMASVHPEMRSLLEAETRLSGNLIPAPGLGLLVLGGTHAVFWKIRD